MTYVYLAAAALVLGPLVGYLGWRLVRGKPTLDRQLSLAAFGWGLLGILALVTGVSFVYTGLNALYAAVAYLAACFLFWHALNLRPRVLRFGVVALGAIPLVLGGCLGSVGFLGLALTIGEVEPKSRESLGGGLAVQTYALGNAIADYRGLRVAVFDRLDLLPLLERNVADTSYYSVIPYREGSLPLRAEPTFEYLPSGRSLVVRADDTFADTLRVD